MHTSMWTMNWDRPDAEKAVATAAKYQMDFIEIALLNPAGVDTAHTRESLEQNGLRAACSLGLPERAWPTNNVDAAIKHLKFALDKTAEMGCEAFSGVTYGGIGQRTGVPPTEDYDKVARSLSAAAAYAEALNLLLGLEPVNRFETHLLYEGTQGAWMLEKVGAENMPVHLNTYHMTFEEKGAANHILDARKHIRYVHLSESNRGTPGSGTCD